LSRSIRKRRLPRSSSVEVDIHFLNLYGCRMIKLPAVARFPWARPAGAACRSAVMYIGGEGD
jgi:hypothetical protein